jgi:hypothetical protein
LRSRAADQTHAAQAAAAGIIKSAIDEGRKHVDQQALKRVYAKLMAAYEGRSRQKNGILKQMIRPKIL